MREAVVVLESNEDERRPKKKGGGRRRREARWRKHRRPRVSRGPGLMSARRDANSLECLAVATVDALSRPGGIELGRLIGLVTAAVRGALSRMERRGIAAGSTVVVGSTAYLVEAVPAAPAGAARYYERRHGGLLARLITHAESLPSRPSRLVLLTLGPVGTTRVFAALSWLQRDEVRLSQTLVRPDERARLGLV